MSTENEKKISDFINTNSTSTISSSAGGALLGGLLGGPAGAIVGGLIGFAIGNPAFQEILSEAKAKKEISEWQEFFNNLHPDELRELKQSFTEITNSSSMLNSLKEWNLLLDNLSSDERKLIKLKRDNFEIEKSLQKKRNELGELNRQIAEKKLAAKEVISNIQDSSTNPKKKKSKAKNKNVQTKKKGRS